MGVKLYVVDDPNTPTALYRYLDEQDRLLYVGISGDLAVREYGHISKSRWMELAASSTIRRHPTRRAALMAERKAIKTELPLFNVQDAAPGARQRLRAYLEEIGRLDLMLPRRHNIPLGELDMAERMVVRRAVDVAPDIAPESGTCAADTDAEYDHLVEVEAALDNKGRPVSERGLLIMHMFDGKACTEVYLNADEARELAKVLGDHADESVAPTGEHLPAGTIVQWTKRRVS